MLMLKRITPLSTRSIIRRMGPHFKTHMSTTVKEEAAPNAYSIPVQAMHWLMGGSVLGCVGFVLAAQNTKGKQKGEYMFLHKSCGLLSFALVGPRIIFRLASKNPTSLPGSAIEQFAASASHTALYGLMLFLSISGVAMGYYGGKGLPFFYTTIPGAEKADGKIAKFSYEYHKIAGQILEYTIPLHFAGTAFHLAKGQSILSRIIPGLAK